MTTPSTMRDTMEITTTVGCPNACKVCPQDLFVSRYKQTRGARQLGLAQFKQCLDKIPKHVRIDFSGFTEPWSNPACTDMILHAHEAGFKITAFTTCVGMTEADVERIQSIPFVTFVVHLPDDGLIMPFPTRRGYREVLAKLCASKLTNLQYMSMGCPDPQAAILVGGNVSGFIRSTRAGNAPGVRPDRKAGAIRCIPSPKMRRNVLLPNGDVVLCCHDYGMEHVLGNLLVCRYEDLFTGLPYRNILAGQDREDSGEVLCRHCEWSGSRLKAESVHMREVVKETLLPMRTWLKQARNFVASPCPSSDRSAGLNDAFIPDKSPLNLFPSCDL